MTTKLSGLVDTPASVVATDGSARGRTLGSAWLSDVGGWSIVSRTLAHGLSAGRGALFAELYALARAEHHHPYGITVLTDSQAAAALVTRWIAGDLVPVPGYQGWALVRFARMVGRREAPFDVQWVRGHDGHPLNEGADTLARLGMRAPADGLTRDDIRARATGIAEAFSRPARRSA